MSREPLETASLTFDEVRSRVRELIGAGAANVALVGHSLECDLHALRLTVPTHGGPMVLDVLCSSTRFDATTTGRRRKQRCAT